MSLFDSILPTDNTPMQTPANLMAQIKGLPITATQASAMSRLTPSATTTPGSALPPLLPSLPSLTAPAPDPIGSLASLRPNLPSLTAPAPTTPRAAGFQAAAQAAGGTQAESNPINTLLISLANGVRAGVPAFRAQKQANQEAAVQAAMQAADYKAHRDFINSPAAARMFGSQVDAARAMSDAELGPWLVKNNIVEPVEFSQNTHGDVAQVKGPGAATAKPIYNLSRPVSPGQQVPRMQMVNGVATPVIGPDGKQVYDVPNPLPTPRAAALSAAQQKENTIRNIAGLGPNDPITDDNREAYRKAVAWVDAQARTPRAMPAPRSGRLVQTEQGIVSVDPVTHEVTPLTDANGVPIQKPKTAAMVKAQSDSALVAKITGAATPAANGDQTAARTAAAKAILAGTRPGDKKVAQDWLKLHP